ADDGRVLELVTAGADADVEPRQGGFVVDRGPIFCDVVDARDALRPVRNGQFGKPSRSADDLSLKAFNGRVEVDRIWVVDPLERVALWFRPSDEHVAPRLSPNIDAKIEVTYRGKLSIGSLQRRRCMNVVDLLAHRRDLDREIVCGPDHLVHDAGLRACCV